ncbi:LysR substrate-binding domain-containing protein [Peribacillus simplex]|uniref:LysR substrate-binding domain-containing protein n=1 Tax=Peribacillus simplex TaxID=1478 RepID=UPI003CFC9705
MGYVFIGLPFSASLEDWLHGAGSAPTNIVEIRTLETMLNCVRVKIGYTLLTNLAVAVSDDRVRAHTVPEQYRFATTRLVCQKE